MGRTPLETVIIVISNAVGSLLRNEMVPTLIEYLNLAITRKVELMYPLKLIALSDFGRSKEATFYVL